MLKNVTDPKDVRELLLSLLSTSGTLAGISLALVGITNFRPMNSRVESIGDDMFLFSSLGFVVVCYFTFFALRRIYSEKITTFTNVIDFTFLFSLTLLVLAGFVTVYTFL